jgi:hypothetical protein
MNSFTYKILHSNARHAVGFKTCSSCVQAEAFCFIKYSRALFFLSNIKFNSPHIYHINENKHNNIINNKNLFNLTNC